MQQQKQQHPLPPRPTVVPRRRHHHHPGDDDDDDVAALSTDDASCGSSHGSTKSEKNMADFDEDDMLERLGAGVDGSIGARTVGAGDELDEADMSVSFLLLSVSVSLFRMEHF